MIILKKEDLLYNEFNNIFIEWDPIAVGAEIAQEEYKDCIPLILKDVLDRNELLRCLENILINKLGLDYDSNNIEHVQDVNVICDKIMQVHKNIMPG